MHERCPAIPWAVDTPRPTPLSFTAPHMTPYEIEYPFSQFSLSTLSPCAFHVTAVIPGAMCLHPCATIGHLLCAPTFSADRMISMFCLLTNTVLSYAES